MKADEIIRVFSSLDKIARLHGKIRGWSHQRKWLPKKPLPLAWRMTANVSAFRPTAVEAPHRAL